MDNHDTILDAVLRIDRKVDDLVEKLYEVRERTAVLETKAGLWGAIGGLVSSAVIAVGIWLNSS